VALNAHLMDGFGRAMAVQSARVQGTGIYVSAVQIITICLTAMGVIIIPMFIWIIKITSKWTKLEEQMSRAVSDIDKLVKDKDKTHEAMLQQMTNDRNATNLRLRWLEEHLWTLRPRAQRTKGDEAA
jgi:hypothetical protein